MSKKYIDIIDARDFINKNREDFEYITRQAAKQKVKDGIDVDITVEVVADLLDKLEIPRSKKGMGRPGVTKSSTVAHNNIKSLALFVVKMADEFNYDVPDNILIMSGRKNKQGDLL